MNLVSRSTRRHFLRSIALGAAAWTVPGVFAEELTRTVSQMEGPFYPDRLPLDTDNDLIVINNSITPAVGTITHLSGRILGANGTPLRNAVVEIWQCDNSGAYLHSDSSNRDKRDRNFQGFGRFLTGTSGEYYFRTIRPVAYPGRTPHIHYKVKVRGQRDFTTQLYVRGEPQNQRDGIFNSVRDPKARDSIQAAFNPLPGSRVGELTARFDVVLGVTPEA
jgi:protocatechuate 3,4-dioxygenase beta subunit